MLPLTANHLQLLERLGVRMDQRKLASMIDLSVLRPNATAGDIEAACSEARRFGFAAVCVNPYRVSLAASLVEGSAVGVASVVAFPLGADITKVKLAEAQAALDSGASELDLVMNIGAFFDGDYRSVEYEVKAIRSLSPTTPLKVIIESALMDISLVKVAARVVVDGGANYVKTSTGFNPAGGASVEAVLAIAKEVGTSAQIKASGGITDTATALSMIEAGATRIGASAGSAIANGYGETVTTESSRSSKKFD
jgi:deoxyribose-phosphate aldolase